MKQSRERESSSEEEGGENNSLVQDDARVNNSTNSSSNSSSSILPSAAIAQPDPQVADPQPDAQERAALPKVVRNGKVYRVSKATTPFLKKHTWPAKPSKPKETKMGKESSPPVYERTTEVSRSLLRYAVVLVLGTLLLSRAMTESWTFGYEGRYTNIMTWIPRPMKTFTEAELKTYDGSDSSLPIYLALDGSVYDVSSNARMYGKGGSYNHFAGRDAARAYVTGCFKSHLTHDVRGFSEKEEKALQGWKRFFKNHAKYYQVGRVLHEPIPPSAPLPEPCDAKAEGGAR